MNLKEKMQEAFSTVVAHARKQNCRAANEIDNCQYRTKEGLKCFIGALIPDELISNLRDGDTVKSILEDIAISDVLIPKCFSLKDYLSMQNFYMSLQRIHDEYNIDNWENEFSELASENELEYTI